MSLAQELYRWLGPALPPHLAELKPVQLKELNESFAELDGQGVGAGSGVQTRFTRQQQRERQVAGAQGTLEGREEGAAAGGSVAEAPAFDPFELVEPVAVLSKLPPDFCEKLASAKWKERKEEALDPLLGILQAPRLKATDDYTELVRALAGRMSDANVACVTVAANALTALARGLRADFARHRSVVVPPVLERLKEKKQSVVDALAETLDAVFASVCICADGRTDPADRAVRYRRGRRHLRETQEPSSPDRDAQVARSLPRRHDQGAGQGRRQSLHRRGDAGAR